MVAGELETRRLTKFVVFITRTVSQQVSGRAIKLGNGLRILEALSATPNLGQLIMPLGS